MQDHSTPFSPLVGQRFGKRVITAVLPSPPRRGILVLTRCDCGREGPTRLHALQSGRCVRCRTCAQRRDQPERVCEVCRKPFYKPYCRRFCSIDCRRGQLRESLEVRFWRRLDRSGDCWLWTGSKSSFGHGQIRTGENKLVATHRLAWELLRGPIPDGLMVCHNCPGGDNPACCNPDHLFLGKSVDNIQDAVRKGRMGQGKGIHHSSHPNPSAAGERNPRARLTREQVKEIRSRYKAGGFTQEQLASEYGVSPSNVGYIVNRETWRHVT